MTLKLIKLNEVIALTSLGRSTVYKFIAEGKFPKQVSLGPNCVAWVEDEVKDWISSKIELRDNDLSV